MRSMVGGAACWASPDPVYVFIESKKSLFVLV
jgi:hypothetical protein